MNQELKDTLLNLAEEIYFHAQLQAELEGYTRDFMEVASEKLPEYLTNEDCDFILGCIHNHSLKLAGLI